MRADTRMMLVRDARTGTHSLVRPIEAEDLGVLVGPAEPEAVNGLMAAKTPSQLVEAVEPLGPLWRDPEDMGERLMDEAAMRRLVADGMLCEPDPARLIEECALDPFWRLAASGAFEREGRNPVSDARQAAERHGLAAMDALLGRGSTGDGRLFALEPMYDWVVMRNLISVAMRLCCVTRIAGGKVPDDVLSRARFRDAERIALGAWLPEGGRGVMALLVAHNGLLADIAKAASCESAAEGRWAYLTLRGAGQRELANDYLSRLDALLGTRRVTLDGYASSRVPLGYLTAAGSVWAALVDHPGRYLMTCKQCGRTVLSTTQGAGREFCGNTCRATFNKARKREASGRTR